MQTTDSQSVKEADNICQRAGCGHRFLDHAYEGNRNERAWGACRTWVPDMLKKRHVWCGCPEPVMA